MTFVESDSAARRLSVQLRSDSLTYLWDHVVAGRSILPGAAMFEMAAAAGQVLLQEGGVQGGGQGLALADAAIPAPVVMTLGSMVRLDCTVLTQTGQLETHSAAGSSQGMLSYTFIANLF